MILTPAGQDKKNISIDSGFLNYDPFFINEDGDFSKHVSNEASLTYDQSGYIGGKLVAADAGTIGIIRSDSYFALDHNLDYRFKIVTKVPLSNPTGIKILPIIFTYDYKFNLVTSPHILELPNTRTTLAVDLVDGATTIQLTDASNWDSSGVDYLSGFRAWRNDGSGQFVYDLDGRKYAEHTYSRELYTGLWGAGAISGNIITLTNQWGGGTIPAGTKVSNSNSTSTYVYPLGSSSITIANNNTWDHRLSGILTGQNSGTYSTTKVTMAGSVYHRVGVLFSSRSDDTPIQATDNIEVGGIGLIRD